MTEHEARMQLVSSVLSYAASFTYFETNIGDPHESDEMDLKEEMLDKAVKEYIQTMTPVESTDSEESK